MDITLDTRQIAQLAEYWQQAPEIASQEMLRAVTEADLIIQGELQKNLPKGAGGLHGAGLVGGVHRQENVVADGVLGMVAESQPYGEYVEVGTKPHLPPIQPLMDWIEAKLGIRDEKSAKGIAFAIRNKIGARGTRPQPVWQETYNKLLPQIQQRLQGGLDRIAVRLAQGGAA